jgi:hypothetical protein
MHLELVRLAKLAQQKAIAVIPELEKEYSSIGAIRQHVKSDLSEEILKIDKIVRKLLIQSGTYSKAMSDYMTKS